MASSSTSAGSVSAEGDTVVEFDILIESIRNIDLLRQGLYAVRCQLYTAQPRPEGASAVTTPKDGTAAAPVLHGPKVTQAMPYHIIKHSMSVQTTANINTRPPKPRRGLLRAPNNYSAVGGSSELYERAWKAFVQSESRGAISASSSSSSSTSSTASTLSLSGAGSSNTVVARSNGSSGGSSSSKSDMSVSEAVNLRDEDDDDDLLDDDDDEEGEDMTDSRCTKEGVPYPSASVDNLLMTFTSQVVRMQYCDQQVVLNDSCLFRLDIPLGSHNPIYLEVALMVCHFLLTPLHIWHYCCSIVVRFLLTYACSYNSSGPFSIHLHHSSPHCSMPSTMRRPMRTRPLCLRFPPSRP